MAQRKSKAVPLVYYHGGEVNELLVEKFLKKPHEVVLLSPGGCLSCMAAIVDYLEDNPTQVRATGICCSAAIPILACGSPRLATRRTRFMVHLTASEGGGDRNLGELLQEREELERSERDYVEILAARTNKPAAWWQKKMSETWYFDADEALKIGLIDKIV